MRNKKLPKLNKELNDFRLNTQSGLHTEFTQNKQQATNAVITDFTTKLQTPNPQRAQMIPMAVPMITAESLNFASFRNISRF